MDTPEDQYDQSGFDTSRPAPGFAIDTYKAVPEELGYKPDDKKSVMPDSDSEYQKIQLRKLTKSLESIKFLLGVKSNTLAKAKPLKTTVKPKSLIHNRQQVLDMWLSQPHHTEDERGAMSNLLGPEEQWIQEEIPLSKVKPNPQTGRDPQGSGSQGPIIIDKNGVIIDGNQRWYDAQDDGLKTIHIIRPK